MTVMISIFSDMMEKLFEAKKRLNYKKKGAVVATTASIGEGCSIGYGTYIGQYTHLDVTTIGRYSSVGDYCVIGPGEHRIRNVSTSYLIYKNHYGLDYYSGDDSRYDGGVIIGNDVWIGCHSVIRRGVKIGNGAVIGACSFVNKDVPEYAVVAGVPARIIRYRFTKEEIIDISNSMWWDEDLDGARHIIEDLERKMM